MVELRPPSAVSYKPAEYWESLARDQLEQAEDPGLLGAVCYAGAPLWLNEFFAHFQRKALTRALRRVRRQRERGVTLEIGCGTGRWCQYLSASGPVVGVDLSPSMVRRAHELGRGPQFCLGMAQSLPFADNTFGLALSVVVLIHVPDELKPACVKELARVLQPGGSVIVYERVRPGLGAQVHPISVDGWVRLFVEQGMRLSRCEAHEYAPLLRLLHLVSKMLPARARTSRLAADQVKRPAGGRAPMTAASLSRLPLPLRLVARLVVAVSYPLEYVSGWLLGSRLANSALMVFEKT
ncbi:MAG: class I SAM-dependent methyltransferase [Dehalococcoidia bacterium]|nr:class I SAM-dependent methyltransferase [Dehalococcoidia bacterium]